jgi:hypothetical protein
MSIEGALLICGIIVFLILMIGLVPKLFLKNRFAIKESLDRGIKKFRMKDEGYGVVYEPDPKVRKYIEQYVLVNQNGQKKMLCKVKSSVSYLDFDVVLFDCANRVTQVLHVQNLVGASGHTEEIALPEDTSYVSVLLNQVDDRVIAKQSTVRISPTHMVGFWISGLLLSVCFSFFIKLLLSRMFGRVFRESFMASASGNALTALLALGIGAVGLLCLSLMMILKNKKK